MIRLTVLISHPIPYFVALWRELEKIRGIKLLVIFFSYEGIKHTYNSKFNRSIKWDQDLLSGYKYLFVNNVAHSDFGKTGLGLAAQYVHPNESDFIFIHGYSDLYAREAVKLAKKNNVKVCMRGPINSKVKPGRLRLKKIFRDFYLKNFFLKRIDLFFYIGKSSLIEYKRLGVSAKKLTFTPYTIDFDNFEKQKLNKRQKLNLRDKLGIPENAFVIIMVGVFSPRKNHTTLLKAIKNSIYRDNYYLLLVGDGPNKIEIKSIASQLGIKNIIFTDFVNQRNLGQYYSISDVFVFPSFYDSWGLVLNEAIQFGLPVIVSDNVAASDDLVMIGENGYLFSPGDFDTLAQLIDGIYLSPRRQFMSTFSRKLSLSYHPKFAALTISSVLRTLD